MAGSRQYPRQVLNLSLLDIDRDALRRQSPDFPRSDYMELPQQMESNWAELAFQLLDDPSLPTVDMGFGVTGIKDRNLHGYFFYDEQWGNMCMLEDGQRRVRVGGPDLPDCRNLFQRRKASGVAEREREGDPIWLTDVSFEGHLVGERLDSEEDDESNAISNDRY